MKEITCLVLGVIGGVAVELIGPWNNPMKALLIFMAIDYATGLVVAGVFRRSGKTENGALESHAGWKGLIKKGGVLLVVVVAYWIDLVANSDFVRNAAIIAFIANEAISILENVGLMGVPIPSVIISAIEVLKKKSESEVKFKTEKETEKDEDE